MQRESDRVGLRQIGAGDGLRLLIVDLGMFPILPDIPISGELAEVPVEISRHLLEKNDRLCPLDVMFVGDDLLLDKFYNLVACLGELLFDVGFVAFEAEVHGVSFFCLIPQSLDDLQLCPPGSHDTFIGRGAKVALLGGEFFLTKQNLVSEGDHLFIAFCLLRQFGQQDIILLFKIFALHKIINQQPWQLITQVQSQGKSVVLVSYQNELDLLDMELNSHILYQVIQSDMTHIDGKLYNLAIEAHLSQATTAVKFPCLFFVQWRTNDQKSSAQSSKYSPQGEKVAFNETITLKTNAIYDRQAKKFAKKQTQLQLNLISKSRPDQPKLVGRVTIDLATLLNDNPYTSPTQLPLQFCSVNAFIVVSFRTVEKSETDISVHEQQRSISEVMGFGSSFKVSTPNFGQQKSKETQSLLKEQSSVSSKIYQAVLNKKQYSNGISSPRSNEQSIFKDSLVKEVKQTTPVVSIKDIRLNLDERSRGSSFKTIKREEQASIKYQKTGSSILEQQNQETFKLKAQFDTLKLQSSKKQQEQQRIRLELVNKAKENQFTKLQLRQNQTLLDQAIAQVSLLRNQNLRLREEASKNKQETVKLTIKLGEIKDSSSKTSQQLSAAQRELKRYQMLNQSLQQSSQVKRQLTSQIINLQKQLNDSEGKLAFANQEKSQLEEFLALKEEEYRKKYQDWSQQKTAQNSNKETLFIELSNSQQKLRIQSNLRQERQNQLKHLQAQVKRLTALSYEFQQAKNSWQITEGLLKDQISRKTGRISELEETVISTGDRVRWLEGQNQLIIETSKQSKQQYNKLQQQKEREDLYYRSQNQKLNTSVKQLFEANFALQKEKEQSLLTINSLIEKYQHLNKEHEAQINQNASLFHNYQLLSSALNQYQQRCSYFEELLLSNNEQRQKQSIQAIQREKTLQLKTLQLQNLLRNTNEHLSISEERLVVLNNQLQNREELLLKLEESLKKQIQRSQGLNARLLGYMQRADKMKDVMAIMQQQQRRIVQLLVEQEVNDDLNRTVLQQKETQIQQLLANLQSSNSYLKQLQQTLIDKQAKYHNELEALNAQISESNAKLVDLQEALSNNSNYIVVLQGNLAHSNELMFEKDKTAEEMQRQFHQLVQQLNMAKTELQSRILDLQQERSNLNELITQKQNQIGRKEEKINEVSEDLFVKQTENSNLSRKIQQLSGQITELEYRLSDFQNQVLLKQSLIEEQTNRYSQLNTQYNSLLNEQTTFDIQKHNEILKQKNNTILTLQNRVKVLETQNSKIVSLERSLKIKTIQLNSMKFKGKSDTGQNNQLLRLKDEEIASLIAEKEKLSVFQLQCTKLQQKVNSLQAQLQLIEEEKFNIESDANEKALVLEQARQENRKLMEQITIIGQKHSQLEKLLAQVTNYQNGYHKSEATSKTQFFIPKKQANDLEGKKNKLFGLQRTDSTFMTNNSQKKSQSNGNHMNLDETITNLKQILSQRAKNRHLDKLLQLSNKAQDKETIKDISVQSKLKALSKDFAKVKALLIKLVEPKHSVQKVKFIDHLRNCETVLNSVLNTLE